MTRAETYRRRAADYARRALQAEPRYQAMYSELARAWRELAWQAEGEQTHAPHPFGGDAA